jgi:hypothetical protein
MDATSSFRIPDLVAALPGVHRTVSRISERLRVDPKDLKHQTDKLTPFELCYCDPADKRVVLLAGAGLDLAVLKAKMERAAPAGTVWVYPYRTPPCNWLRFGNYSFEQMIDALGGIRPNQPATIHLHVLKKAAAADDQIDVPFPHVIHERYSIQSDRQLNRLLWGDTPAEIVEWNEFRALTGNEPWHPPDEPGMSWLERDARKAIPRHLAPFQLYAKALTRQDFERFLAYRTEWLEARGLAVEQFRSLGHHFPDEPTVAEWYRAMGLSPM